MTHHVSSIRYEREDGSSFTSLGYEMDWLWALGLNSSSEAAAAAAAALPLQPPSEPQAPPLPPSSIGPVENALDILGGVYGFNNYLVSFYVRFTIPPAFG